MQRRARQNARLRPDATPGEALHSLKHYTRRQERHLRDHCEKHTTYYSAVMAVKRICETTIRNEKPILPVSAILHGWFCTNASNMELVLDALFGSCMT